MSLMNDALDVRAENLDRARQRHG
ncbi:DUF6889 family protein [Bordetella avium]